MLYISRASIAIVLMKQGKASCSAFQDGLPGQINLFGLTQLPTSRA